MSEFADIENAVVSLIEGIEDSGAPVFATVQGLASAERKGSLAAVARLVKPAALVVIEGRARSAASAAVPGDPQVSVVIAGSSLRSADGARVGEVDGFGGYELANLVTLALDGAVLESTRRMRAVSERIVAADERVVVIEQHWLAERPAELSLPTYGGETITGTEAVVSVEVGDRRTAAVEFGFPGVDGVYRHVVGTLERSIRWKGQLRAASHSALTAVESAIEALVGDGQEGTVADSFGRTFENCAVEEFQRSGPRRMHPLTGVVAQDFELDFVQAAG